MQASYQFIHTPHARFTSCHAASLSLLPDGRLAVVYFAGGYEGSSDSAHLFSYLRDDGTWHSPAVLQATEGRAAGNAILWTLPEGRIALIYTLSHSSGRVIWDEARIYARYSWDAGASWSEQHTITEELGFICRQPGLVLDGGEWLLPIYDNRNLDAGNEGSVLISDDQGRHWQRYGRPADG
ncbi:MAG: exo-alpha-sialidase [Chloroflexi bacterium]|mgnify:CR=1 FL=1|nr:exo-alpha-sialidase [Chloroflexota bacterium]